MEPLSSSHATGISAIAFIISVAVSLAYYQFMYLPQANAKPVLPEEVVNPPETTKIAIAEGANVESNGNFFVPKETRGVIGISNRIIWTNDDYVGHTVTSDDPKYVDKLNGPFNSLEQLESVPGGYVLPGKAFEFTFTAVGKYSYHCEPHPWMQGSVEVVENFA